MLSNGVKIWLVTWHFITTSECFVEAERVIMLYGKRSSCGHACRSLKFKVCPELVSVLDCQKAATLFFFFIRGGRGAENGQQESRMSVSAPEFTFCKDHLHMAESDLVSTCGWPATVLPKRVSKNDKCKLSTSLRRNIMLEAHVHWTQDIKWSLDLKPRLNLNSRPSEERVWQPLKGLY